MGVALWRVCVCARAVQGEEPFDSWSRPQRKDVQPCRREWKNGSRSSSTRRTCWQTFWPGWRRRAASTGPTSLRVSVEKTSLLSPHARARAHSYKSAFRGAPVCACVRVRSSRMMDPWLGGSANSVSPYSPDRGRVRVSGHRLRGFAAV